MPPFHPDSVLTVFGYKQGCEKVDEKKIYQLINKSYLNYHLPVPPQEYYLHPFQQRFIDPCSLKSEK